jgi:hypothetical protein
MIGYGTTAGGDFEGAARYYDEKPGFHGANIHSAGNELRVVEME